MKRQLNRSYGKIVTAPQAVKETVDEMLASRSFKYADIISYMASQGISIGKSAVSEYARNFQDEIDTLRIAHENFKLMSAEVERHPDIDYTEVMSRIAAQQMMNALSSKSAKDWDEVGVEKITAQINSMTNAIAYKNRVEMQNKEKIKTAIDDVRADIFKTLSAERPDLFKEVSAELVKIQKKLSG